MNAKSLSIKDVFRRFSFLGYCYGFNRERMIVSAKEKIERFASRLNFNFLALSASNKY